jgi:hypothetical protein
MGVEGHIRREGMVEVVGAILPAARGEMVRAALSDCAERQGGRQQELQQHQQRRPTARPCGR